jgi:hypothetical protein
MEVGQHRFDDFEFEDYFGIWVDEEVGGCGASDDCSCAGSNGMFKRANRCGADCDYTSTGTAREIDGGGGAGGDGVGFGVKLVILDAIDADGLESSEAYVQRDLGSLDAVLADTVENLSGEVETGGGRGY